MTVTILNTSILTQFGSFNYEQISLEQAKELIADGFDSAVGHESTASVISTLLGAPVPVNRQAVSQQVGDVALVFKLNGRAPEGTIMTAAQINEMGFVWGKLTRTA